MSRRYQRYKFEEIAPGVKQFRMVKSITIHPKSQLDREIIVFQG